MGPWVHGPWSPNALYCRACVRSMAFCSMLISAVRTCAYRWISDQVPRQDQSLGLEVITAIKRMEN